MRGENAYGYLKAALLFIVVGVVAYLIYKTVSKIRETGGSISDALGGVSGVVEAVDPTSQNNVFNQAFNAATKALEITGDDRTIGSWLYDVFNADKMAAITAPTPYPVTRKSVITPADDAYYPTDAEDAEMGIAMRGIVLAETPGGAVTGIVRRRRR